MVLPAGQLSSLDFGSYEEMKKQRWTCIDILKCLAALAVVEIHKPLKVQSGAELLILCRFAVPVFFMITGFFYSETVAHRRELKQIGKILTITIGANLFYLIWKVLLALEDENNIKMHCWPGLKKNARRFHFMNFPHCPHICGIYRRLCMCW